MFSDGDIPPQYRVWRREDGSPWQLGHGTAYKATDLRTDDVVVLRFFEARIDHFAEKTTLARLAQTLSKPGSPHLNPVRDLFIRDRTHLAVTNFVEGQSLAEGIAEHGRPTGEAVLGLAREALEALNALHRAGIAHGSVSPAKLLFAPPDDALRIIDGGLHPAATIVAPPAGNAGTADDLRRLGVTLWFALTGTLPFAEGLAAPADASPDWKQLDALPASGSLRSLLALFTRTLNPGGNTRRPQTAADLLAALEAQGFLPRTTHEPAGDEPGETKRDLDQGPQAEEASGTPAVAARRSNPPSAPAAGPTGVRKVSGIAGLAALMIGLAATWFVQARLAQRSEREQSNAPASPIKTTKRPVPETPTTTNLPAVPGSPALTGGPPVSAVGIQARAMRIRDTQPDTLEALKAARELRRVATLPVTNGRGFPTRAEVGQVKEALDVAVSETSQTHRTALVLVLGYSDQSTMEGEAAESQEESDALASALFHDGITAPVYACGLGGREGVPEVDAPVAGDGAFAEVWVAFLLF